MAPRKILVLFAHPVLERSRANRRLLEGITGLPGVTIHDLYERYPSMELDVAEEQARLEAHDVIVFQHPFYWYSAPAIVKEWQDLVLEHGWAYGERGHHLDGKITFNAITTGGPEHAYQVTGYNRFTMRQFLAPFDQTASLCRMRFLPPFVVHAAMRIASDEDARVHVQDYRRLLGALRDDELDLEAAARADRLNASLDALIRGAAS